jgi:hypothetical protein
MKAIFEACDRLNIQVAIYRTSSDYAGDMRWSCNFQGGDSEGRLEVEAKAPAADAAVELAWHRFQRLASGQLPTAKAIAAESRS